MRMVARIEYDLLKAELERMKRVAVDQQQPIAPLQTCTCSYATDIDRTTHSNECAASTDPSPWLREFGMRVAEEAREATVERIGRALTREEWDAVLAAIVDRVMK